VENFLPTTGGGGKRRKILHEYLARALLSTVYAAFPTRSFSLLAAVYRKNLS